VPERLTYDIPIALTAVYRGERTIIRIYDPAEIDDKISSGLAGDIACLRILSPDGVIDPLRRHFPGLPVEFELHDPCKKLPLLYRYAPLLSDRPVRVSIPLLPGFGSAVKLAASLNFAVKVCGGQPDQPLVEEMLRIADYYLRRPAVTEPIDFFHSLFLAFYHHDPVTLWAIQDEDPAVVRYVDDHGNEALHPRLSGGGGKPVTRFMEELADDIASGNECAGCEFVVNCHGYFKRPRKEYRCDGIREVLRTLKDAAGELRRDLASFGPSPAGDSR